MTVLLAFPIFWLFAYFVVRMEQQREKRARPPEAQIPELRKNAGNAGMWTFAIALFAFPVMPIFFYMNRRSFISLLIGLFWMLACSIAATLIAALVTGGK